MLASLDQSNSEEDDERDIAEGLWQCQRRAGDEELERPTVPSKLAAPLQTRVLSTVFLYSVFICFCFDLQSTSLSRHAARCSQLVFGQLCSMAVRPGPQTPPIYNGFAEMTVP